MKKHGLLLRKHGFLSEYAGLDYHYAINGGFDYVHMLGSSHRGGLF